MSMGNIFSILSILALIYVSWGRRKEIKETYKKLTMTQLLSVIISYTVAIFVAVLLIYYGRNWLVSYIPFEPLKFVVSIIIIITVLACCLQVLNKVLKKISNGIL
ncbi:hypothetical protein CON65_05530 [Bacillus pseudomycoides]|uniref:Uncharacterized protein n=2 Tax=Bacillus TaxID=1386 RepID=A0AA91VES9_9BACI|nr:MULTISPECIES: hypothetical protein [Bacillus]PEB51716.1 hypothetical protein COO03_15780 [Bacillus sp. AFS098217]PED83684.1 hypothetical protein CON65_05530 [Bacillus pseudomycoides]PEU21688.1 hypothetical protein CN525_01205 [Bacillus sp. AFS014408]PFW62049.1 hypothetical protein COL20_14445 [Bacillus sp. AFS075034]